MTKEKLKELLDAAYLAGWAGGWGASAEGWNYEMSGDVDTNALLDAQEWRESRDEELAKVLEQTEIEVD